MHMFPAATCICLLPLLLLQTASQIRNRYLSRGTREKKKPFLRKDGTALTIVGDRGEERKRAFSIFFPVAPCKVKNPNLHAPESDSILSTLERSGIFPALSLRPEDMRMVREWGLINSVRLGLLT
ncbi:hypothetical protein F4820DRAFT_309835 [Hypoxylon rubiginosum]|uniref:Uncharacterized protein n=1 Tax=Hypoxylon rubiginosum TaxID=110542 RepID=A0ACB9Z082_9PEZI|nr:hypothetical protein F4820DRAFT_309835 [Hypoxylon rubiginosum]